MPSAETLIKTENAATYLTRLCGHLGKLAAPRRFPGHAPRSHAGGQPPAVLHVEHTAGELMIRADAASQEDLRRLQDMTAGRLLKFGRREHLDIEWTAVPDTA